MTRRRQRRDSPVRPDPQFLTVEEAAEVLRIGRTSAYALAREYLAGNVSSGLPVIRIGKQLRVPRGALEEWMGGPIDVATSNVTPTGSSRPTITTSRHRKHRVRRDHGSRTHDPRPES
jgi:excisionase family DNA binding protein